VQGFPEKYRSEARMIFPGNRFSGSGLAPPLRTRWLPLPVGLKTAVFYIFPLFRVYPSKGGTYNYEWAISYFSIFPYLYSKKKQKE
jgi:hypothetical protein